MQTNELLGQYDVNENKNSFTWNWSILFHLPNKTKLIRLSYTKLHNLLVL